MLIGKSMYFVWQSKKLSSGGVPSTVHVEPASSLFQRPFLGEPPFFASTPTYKTAVLLGSSVIASALPPSVIGPKGGPRSVSTPSFRLGAVPFGANVLLCVRASHAPLLTHARGRPSKPVFRAVVPQPVALAPPSLPIAPTVIEPPAFDEPPVALASDMFPPAVPGLPALPPAAFGLPALPPFELSPPAPLGEVPPWPLAPLEG